MSRVDEALRRASGIPGSPDDQETSPVPDRALLDRLDIRRHWPAEAERLPASGDRTGTPPAPVFAELSLESLGDGLERKVVIDHEMMPASREQYRRLAATLHQTQAVNGLKVVMVVSAVASEGKTLTAANLSLTFSESYRRKVLLIDGDLRRPSIDALFKIDGAPGLNEGLTSPVEHLMQLRPITPRLMVLPAGRATADPIAGLTGERMRRLIDEARAAFDWVILDTPPIALLPDANLLAAMADGAVLVVRAGGTPYHLVQRAVEALGRERLLGVVLNRADETQAGYYGYSRYYGTGQPGATR
jgi:capsular exopolysaccharide synthesis family protein